MRGRLISFEGIDGAGKTTQVQLLRDYLQKRGEQVLLTREPGGTYIAEQIRQILLDPQNKGMDELTQVLLFQAARAQIYREVVLPALERGTSVIMDRSRDSSVVYQGIAGGMGREMIERLNDVSTRQTIPDITFLLDVPVKIGKLRREGEEPDLIELQKNSFFQKVRRGYLQLYEEDTTGRIKKIDATKPIAHIAAQIVKLLEEWDSHAAST
ncbi:dTMP kinase [bacterium]|nr:dTMP kinase [bacterium]